MYRNIAISGDIGTGKTTLAKNLAAKLGFKIISTGEYVRNWYKKHNLNLNETTQIPEEVDRQIDSSYQKMMQQESGLIFESRLAGWLARDLTDVFKVLCTVDTNEASRRASRRDGTSVEEAKKNNEIRDEGLKKKFKKYYGVENYLDPKYFNLVVDTTTKSPEQVLEQVLEKLTSN